MLAHTWQRSRDCKMSTSAQKTLYIKAEKGCVSRSRDILVDKQNFESRRVILLCKKGLHASDLQQQP